MSVVAQKAYEQYFGQSDRSRVWDHNLAEEAEARVAKAVARKSISKWTDIHPRDETYWLDPQVRTGKHFSTAKHAFPVLEVNRIVGVHEFAPAVDLLIHLGEHIAAEDHEADLHRKFRFLVHQWREATKYTSSSTEIVMNEAYQRIIGLGPRVIPLVLTELRDRGGHWFWALRALTGENPVDPADAGRVKKMSQAWLDWGRKMGLI